MSRRCTTVPGYGTCCRAAQQGLLNRPFQMTDSKGNTRCASCSTRQSTSRDPRKAGRTVFQFRFEKNTSCGIGPHGCPYIAGGQGQGQLQIGGPTGSVLNP